MDYPHIMCVDTSLKVDPCCVSNVRQLLAPFLEAVFLYEVTCKVVWIETDFQGSNGHNVAKILTVDVLSVTAVIPPPVGHLD